MITDADKERIKAANPIERVIGAEVSLKKEGKVLKGLCPFHTDKHPSLDVKPAEQFFICGACGAKGDVFTWVMKRRHVSFTEALKILGGENSESQKPKRSNLSTRKFERTYSYHDAAGSYVFDKDVYRYPDGTKDVPYRIREGEKVTHYNIDHLNGKAEVLYRLPELRRDIAAGKTIYLNEGEKASDLMRSLGLSATSTRLGATGIRDRQPKWHGAYTEQLRGAKEIVIIADRDETGEHHARLIYKILRDAKVSQKISVVQCKPEIPKADAADHFQEGWTAQDLVPRCDLMGILSVKSIETYDFETPEYLFGQHVRLGTINLLDADGGTGKTTFMLALAASGSNGYDPIGKRSIEPFRTLYFGAEDSAGELRTVYRNLGGKEGFLDIFDGDFRIDSDGLFKLEETIHACNYKMIDFDALIYYLSGLVKNTNDALELAPHLAGLRNVAMRTGCAILNARHTGKGTLGKSPAELGIGSVQFRNSHRSQLLIRWHPDRNNFPGQRVVTHEKGSIMTPTGEPFGFTQKKEDNGSFGWVYDVDLGCFETDSKGNGNKVSQALELIRRLASGRYCQSSTIAEQAEAEGIGVQGALKRAREQLVKSGDLVIKRLDASGPFYYYVKINGEEEPYDPFA